jgi:hypothetical protein
MVTSNLMEIKLEPCLSSCIETVAKREYKKVLSILLKPDQEDAQMEEKLELLKLFLESADFNQLRSLSDKFLLKGERVEFILKSTNNPPKYEIEINQV